MVDAYLGLGSNLGDKEANIRRAVELLDWECTVLRMSRLYRSEPVGCVLQDWFLNCAVECETTLKPLELLGFLKETELRMGRRKTIRGGPRVIDVDILFYGDVVLNTAELTIPHPRLHERLFVLAPLSELCAEYVHPVFKRTVRSMCDELIGRQKVELYL